MPRPTAAQYRERILQNYEYHADSCEFYQYADPDESYEDTCDCDLVELVVDFEIALKREQHERTERITLESIERDTGISITKEKPVVDARAEGTRTHGL